RHVVNDLLERCNIPLDKVPYDQDFHDECKEILESEFHVPMSLYPFLETYISVGVYTAITCCTHLPKANQIHVAIFTALVATMDDIFYDHHTEMEGFNERIVQGLTQNHPILDALVKNIQDTFKLYNRIQSSLFVTSNMDFVNSLMLDMEIRKVTNFNQSAGFATYKRGISGVQVGYAMLIFPKDIDVGVYIQYLPQMSIYINYMNDVLSYYKEELKGEEENLVTLLAKESGITNYEAFQRVADDVAEADRIILEGLASNQRALNCWKSYRAGYVRFHISSPRYKLDELFEVSV
ncbi:terpenoid synthase, partial [Marasmius fiardii PR-910]